MWQSPRGMSLTYGCILPVGGGRLLGSQRPSRHTKRRALLSRIALARDGHLVRIAVAPAATLKSPIAFAIRDTPDDFTHGRTVTSAKWSAFPGVNVTLKLSEPT